MTVGRPGGSLDKTESKLLFEPLLGRGEIGGRTEKEAQASDWGEGLSLEAQLEGSGSGWPAGPGSGALKFVPKFWQNFAQN